MIHAARPKKFEKSEWTMMLYATAYGYLFVNDITIRLGSLYALYLIYETQPHVPKVKVPVSIELWKELKILQYQTIELQIKECYAILRKMKQENAFCFTVTVNIIHPQTLRLTNNFLIYNPTPPETLDLSEIDTLVYYEPLPSF
jgi:Trm5-related predicted tRNA methylase